MFCSKCGNELPNNVKFCTQCGAPVKHPVKNNTPASEWEEGAGLPSAVPDYEYGEDTGYAQDEYSGAAGLTQSDYGSDDSPSQREFIEAPKPEKRVKKPRPEPVKKEKPRDPVGKALFIIVILLIILFLFVGALLLLPYFTGEKKTSSGKKGDATEESADKGDSDKKSGIGKEESQSSEAATEAVPDEGEKEKPSTGAESTEAQNDDSESEIHDYEFIKGDVSWKEAVELCRKRGGYLARINSMEEFKAITDKIRSKGLEKCIFWIGASRSPSSKEYYWVDKNGELSGDPVKLDSVWLSGEPSYKDKGSGSDELYVDLLYRENVDTFYLNDVPNDIISLVSSYSGRVAYICELE